MPVAVQTSDIEVASGEHVVHFYEHTAELVGAVAPYLVAAARAGEAAIVIATEAHRRALEVELADGGIDLAQARASGMFLSLDAAATLASFTSAGRIDHDGFHEVIGGLVRRASGSRRMVRAYGEMVSLLWDAGDVLAAIELETLWNDIARELPFSLCCSYPAASLAGDARADALHQICHLHSAVLGASLDGERSVGDRAAENELAARLPAERDAPSRARRLVVAALRERGYDGSVVDDAALVVSEMATNAVLHAGSAFSISIRIEDSRLRIAVEDASPVGTGPGGAMIPRPMHGLALIDMLATRWGVEGTPGGKVVWAELQLAASAPGRPQTRP